jgi:eukaryotic-like serine/threonine-protein kinase
MTPERWQQLKQIFQSALERNPAERSAFLSQACADDPALRSEVESLISSHDQAGDSIEAMAADAATEMLADDRAIVDKQIGHYQVLNRIGRGGMGEVFLAQDTSLGRRVALKLLRSDFTRNEERLRRFRQEARAASALNHPNILTIHEIVQEGSLHFMATEYVEGETLREHISRARMALGQVLDVAVQVASALAAAHNAGIVHRDIKPENIMLRTDGYVKVLDFGLAKLTEKEEVAPAASQTPTRAQVKTTPGTVMGTVAYMSPEQARGKEVDARTDIFSLGAVLYEMLTGRMAFAGETTADVLGALLHKEPLPLKEIAPDTPTELQHIVSKALRKEADERYQTMKSLLADLRTLKNEMEFAAKLERSAAPERNEATSAAQGPAPVVTANAEVAGASTQAAAVRPTSSAEFIASGIKQHKRGITIALVALLLAALGFGYWYSGRPSSTTTQIESIAVLPFLNASGDANLDYLSDGLSESLINKLSQLPHLKVIARSSSFKYSGENIDIQEVARKLGVQGIVMGKVLLRGDNLSIRVEMVDARDNKQLWGEQYNRKATDTLVVQQEIAQTIAEKLRLKLTGEQKQQLAKRPTENPEAYQLYLNGQFYFRKNGFENVRKALDYFNQSVALDPKFALAWIGIADVYRWFSGYSMLDSQEANAKARTAVSRALELDESLADAHRALAGIKLDEWDWGGAEREYKRAIELDPNRTNAHNYYSYYLSIVMGQHAEALAEIKLAQELDPLRINLRVGEGTILLHARRYDEAIAKLQEAIRLEPDNIDAHFYLGFSYAMKGRYAEAIAEYQKTMSLNKENSAGLCYLGYALAMSGKRGEALAVLNKLKTTKEYVSPAELAVLYIGLGDKEGALAELEKAYSAHDLQMQNLKAETHYDSLRSDPRFADLLRRVALPQ